MGLGSAYKTINVAHGIKSEDGTNIDKVCIGHWLPEDDGLIVHRSDRVAGSIEEWLQQLIAQVEGSTEQPRGVRRAVVIILKKDI